MLRRIDLTVEAAELHRALPRAQVDVGAAVRAVTPIVTDVRERGYPAVRDATLRFDGVDVPDPRVPAGALAEALATLDPTVRAALTESIRRARIVHEAQRRAAGRHRGGARRHGHRALDPGAPGRAVRARRTRAVYPSSVVMNVVPAQVAGVESIAVCSPPQQEIRAVMPHPTILAACALLGVDEVYAVGGAQAIALARLRRPRPPASSRSIVVTGPGNVYVAAAKRLVRGVVGIDAEAGPTEIAVLADGTADPVHVAADLISQAEHDPLAASVLVTDSVELADAVDARARPAGRAHQAHRADPRGARRRAVGDGARSRPRAGPAGRRRATPPSISR